MKKKDEPDLTGGEYGKGKHSETSPAEQQHHRQQNRGDSDADADADSPMKGFRDEYAQAALLKKDVRTIRRWRRERVGPAWTRNGIVVLYHDDWTRQWLEGQKVEPPRNARRKRKAA